MADELIESAEFGKKNKDEEPPILVAQRFLNIYRQMHIFNKDRQEEFNDMLLEMTPEVRILLSTLPGGGLLLEHIAETEQKRGVVPSATLKTNTLRKKESAPATTSLHPTDQHSEMRSSGGGVVIDASFANELSSSLSIALQQSEKRHKDEMRTLTETLTHSILESQTAMIGMMRDILISTKLGKSTDFATEKLENLYALHSKPYIPNQSTSAPAQAKAPENKLATPAAPAQAKAPEVKPATPSAPIQAKAPENKPTTPAAPVQTKAPEIKPATPAAPVQTKAPEVKPAAPAAPVQTKAPEVKPAAPAAPVQAKAPEIKPATPAAPVQAKAPEVKPAAPAAPIQAKAPEVKPATPAAPVQAKAPENKPATPFIALSSAQLIAQEAKKAAATIPAQAKAPEVKPATPAAPTQANPFEAKPSTPVASLQPKAPEPKGLSLDDIALELQANNKPSEPKNAPKNINLTSNNAYQNELDKIKNALQNNSEKISLDDIDDIPVSLDDIEDDFDFVPLSAQMEEKKFISPQDIISSNDDEEWEWEYVDDDSGNNSDEWEWEYVDEDSNSDEWEWEYIEDEENNA